LLSECGKLFRVSRLIAPQKKFSPLKRLASTGF